MHRLIHFALALFVSTGALAAAEVDDLRLVPFPKEIRRATGEFSLERPLVLEAPAAEADALARLLNEELSRAGLKSAATQALPSPRLAFRLAAGTARGEWPVLPPGENPERYSLEVRADEVVCAAARIEDEDPGWKMVFMAVMVAGLGKRMAASLHRDSGRLVALPCGGRQEDV